MSLISDMLNEIQDVQFNVHALQRVMTRAVTIMSEGKYKAVEPSNPFIFALEAATMLASNGLQRNETLIRKQYPELAQTYEDLYPHMSDVDYLDRFAKPNEAEMVLLLSYDEVIAKSVPSEYGVKKMILPADTTFSVDGLDFNLVYPVEFRVQPHGGLQIVYDASKKNPLYNLNTNVVDWRVVNMPDQSQELAHLKMIFMRVKVLQVTIKSHYDQLNDFSGFSRTYSFSDKYHHTRVYMLDDGDKEWEEIKTTHSDQVYDSHKVTAVLKVTDGKVGVSIPSIYFTKGMVHPSIRIDVYSTKGKLNIGLERFTPNSYTARWEDKRKTPDKYSNVINDIDTMLVYSESNLNAGHDGLTFEDLRRRVISGSLGNQVVPITPVQLENEVRDLGFDVIKDVDHITNRLYVATRGLGAPSSGTVSTPVGCTIQEMKATIEQLAALSTVYEHHERLTIASGTLFELSNGVLKLVSNEDRDVLLTGTLDNLITVASERQFLYNPIHYVIDYTSNLRTRSYFLDNPVVNSKEFVAENPSVGLEVSTLRYGISKIENGYSLSIYSKSSDLTKELIGDKLKLQLRYKPLNEQLYAYMDVPLIGTSKEGEYIFEAKLLSDFDINSEDQLVFNNFSISSTDFNNTYCPLTVDMELMYIVEDYYVEGIRNTEIDKAKHAGFLSSVSYVINQESLNIRFGYRLKDLWDRCRSAINEIDVLRYDNDMPYTWPEDQFERDPLTGSYILTYDEDTKRITTVKTANKGDPIIIDGVVQIKHRAGDPKLDGDLRPIPLNERSMSIIADLMLFEGAYYFADERSAIRTRNEAVSTIIDWVVKDIPKIQGRLLENTNMLFKPKQNIGWVDVYVNSGIKTSISSDQKLVVKVYMDETTFNDYSLKQSIESVSKNLIVEELSKPVVSILNMSNKIKEQMVDGVLDIKVSGLGGSANYDIVTTADASVSLSLAKKLDIMSDETIAVRDDILFEYIKHSSNKK